MSLRLASIRKRKNKGFDTISTMVNATSENTKMMIHFITTINCILGEIIRPRAITKEGLKMKTTISIRFLQWHISKVTIPTQVSS